MTFLDSSDTNQRRIKELFQIYHLVQIVLDEMRAVSTIQSQQKTTFTYQKTPFRIK